MGIKNIVKKDFPCPKESFRREYRRWEINYSNGNKTTFWIVRYKGMDRPKFIVDKKEYNFEEFFEQLPSAGKSDLLYQLHEYNDSGYKFSQD